MTSPPSIARASAIIGLGNILSRVLGLVRESVLANIFGASAALVAFNNAVLVARGFFDLLIAGHVNSAIVPVLSEIEHTQGRAALWRVLSALAGAVILALAVFSLVMIALSGPIAALIGGGDAATLRLTVPSLLPREIVEIIGRGNAATVDLTAQLIRFTTPALILMSLFALYSGTLYALRVFTYPALAAAVFNGTMVVFTLLFAHGPDAIYGVAAAWVAAAAAQLLLQLWGLRSGRLGVSFNFRGPLVRPVLRRIGRLYAPVIGSLAVDLATTRFFTYALAARAAIAHGNNYINWATTLIQLPQGLVATAISAAVLPMLSRAAVAEREGRAGEEPISPPGPLSNLEMGSAADDSVSSPSNVEAESISNELIPDSPLSVPERGLGGEVGSSFTDTLGLGLRLTTVLILPAAFALAVLAVPIIQLVFERGQFTPYDTSITAPALRFYLIGLPFAAWDLLLVYAFYAQQDTLTPALIGVFSLVVYMLAALLLTPAFGLYALMLADAVKHITHAAVSAVLLWRRRGGFPGQRLIPTLGKALAASAGMAAAGYLTVTLVQPRVGTGTLPELVTVAASLAACGVTYAALAYALRLDEFRAVVRLVLRRVRG